MAGGMVQGEAFTQKPAISNHPCAASFLSGFPYREHWVDRRQEVLCGQDPLRLASPNKVEETTVSFFLNLIFFFLFAFCLKLGNHACPYLSSS